MKPPSLMETTLDLREIGWTMPFTKNTITSKGFQLAFHRSHHTNPCEIKPGHFPVPIKHIHRAIDASPCLVKAMIT